MHIAYLIPTIERIGGAERQLLLLANGMAERGWRVTLISLHGSGRPLMEKEFSANVSCLSLGMRSGLRDIRGWKTLRQLITSTRPDIVHAHLAQASLTARGIRVMAPMRILIDTIHSPATGSAARRRAYGLTSRIPDCVTAVSRAAARSWLDEGIVDTRTMAIIPNGVDTERWNQQDRARHGNPGRSNSSNTFRWLAVGRLDPVKDYQTMLRAFAMLAPFARLSICGSGPLENELRSLAAHLGIQDRVTFLGFQHNVVQFMHTHDAFVLSSRWEGMPLALLEASASGLPAVFTELDGCREVLPDSHLPLAPAGNPEALAASMKGLMEMEESARTELGKGAQRLIVGRFDLKSSLDRYETLYRHLLSKNPSSSRFRQHQHLSLQSLAF